MPPELHAKMLQPSLKGDVFDISYSLFLEEFIFGSQYAEEVVKSFQFGNQALFLLNVTMVLEVSLYETKSQRIDFFLLIVYWVMKNKHLVSHLAWDR